MTPVTQRVLSGAVLLVAGILSLPLSAALFDGPTTENWILPIQLLAMAGIGACLTVAFPALAPAGAGSGRRLVVGVGWGIAAALCGVALFWFLLNGLRGA